MCVGVHHRKLEPSQVCWIRCRVCVCVMNTHSKHYNVYTINVYAYLILLYNDIVHNICKILYYFISDMSELYFNDYFKPFI